ncbi:Na/Pi cotransporter family protein [Flavobacteriaceae bacterium Ap0902]|nr:Na/Pi cotransporter family protein [Flavobacteriaceae bacterium Ap0902]
MDIWIILNSIGAVALFLFGMKLMSDSVQQASGMQLRKFLNSMTHSKIRALIAGLGLTSVIQSSSAVSVLVISFVNAGLLNLIRAFSIIIGSNIGTTLTLWVVALGFEVHLTQISLAILGFVIPFYFFAKHTIKKWAAFLIGFALIFISLNLLQEYLAPLAQGKFIFNLFEGVNPTSGLNPILFILAGLVLTLFVQSSSASTSIMVVLYTLGMPLEACAMIIIGANIGTTLTGQIAASIGNKYARYVAHFHTLFNVFGAIIFYFLAFPLMRYIIEFVDDGFVILAIFHTIFNVVTAMIVFPFLNDIVSLLYKHNLQKVENDSLHLMRSPFNVTPEIYIYEATNMLSTFAGNIKLTVNFLGRMITESDEDKFIEFHERVILLEKQGDDLELQIFNYLHKLFLMDLTGSNSQKINNLINVSKELEKIGDLAIKISHTHKDRRESSSFITPKLRTFLLEIQDALSSATTQFIQNLNEVQIDPDLPQSRRLEKKINNLHDKAFDALLIAVEKNKIKPLSAMHYRELIQNYELIGDHIYNANQSLIR